MCSRIVVRFERDGKTRKLPLRHPIQTTSSIFHRVGPISFLGVVIQVIARPSHSRSLGTSVSLLGFRRRDSFVQEANDAGLPAIPRSPLQPAPSFRQTSPDTTAILRSASRPPRSRYNPLRVDSASLRLNHS